MSLCTGSRIITNYERIASWGGCQCWTGDSTIYIYIYIMAFRDFTNSCKSFEKSKSLYHEVYANCRYFYNEVFVNFMAFQNSTSSWELHVEVNLQQVLHGSCHTIYCRFLTYYRYIDEKLLDFHCKKFGHVHYCLYILLCKRATKTNGGWGEDLAEMDFLTREKYLQMESS